LLVLIGRCALPPRKNADVAEVMEAGQRFLTQQPMRLDYAYEMLNEAVTMLLQCCGGMYHSSVAKCFAYVSTLVRIACFETHVAHVPLHRQTPGIHVVAHWRLRAGSHVPRAIGTSHSQLSLALLLTPFATRVFSSRSSSPRACSARITRRLLQVMYVNQLLSLSRSPISF